MTCSCNVPTRCRTASYKLSTTRARALIPSIIPMSLTLTSQSGGGSVTASNAKRETFFVERSANLVQFPTGITRASRRRQRQLLWIYTDYTTVKCVPALLHQLTTNATAHMDRFNTFGGSPVSLITDNGLCHSSPGVPAASPSAYAPTRS